MLRPQADQPPSTARQALKSPPVAQVQEAPKPGLKLKLQSTEKLSESPWSKTPLGAKVKQLSATKQFTAEKNQILA